MSTCGSIGSLPRGCGVVLGYLVVVAFLSYMPELVGPTYTLSLGVLLLSMSLTAWRP